MKNFSSFSVLEQLGLDKVDHKKTKPLNILERFLFNIESDEFKKKVFVNGGFHKKFSSKTGTDTVQSVSALYNSIKIVRRDPFANTEFHNGGPFLQLEGSQPKVIIEFLISLVEAAKKNVNTEINEIHRSTVKTIINNLSTQIVDLQQKITVQKQIEKEKNAMLKQMEIEELHQQVVLQEQIEKLEKQKKAMKIEELHQQIVLQEQIEKEKNAMLKQMKIEELHQQIVLQEQVEKLEKQKKAMKIEELHQQIVLQEQIEQEKKEMEIARLSEALDMAKHMGIKNNNLAIPGSGSFPLWFRYGELALQEKIKMLKSKEKETSKTKNLFIEKEKLKLKRLQKEIPYTKNLSIEKLKLKSLQKETSKTKNLSIEKEKLKLKNLQKEIPYTKNLSIAKLKFKNLQKEKNRSLRSKKEPSSNIKKLFIEKAKLKRFQTAELPLLKFKVVTIGEHSYALTKPYQSWIIIMFGVVFGLLISIVMAVCIDLKQLKAKKIPSAST